MSPRAESQSSQTPSSGHPPHPRAPPRSAPPPARRFWNAARRPPPPRHGSPPGGREEKGLQPRGKGARVSPDGAAKGRTEGGFSSELEVSRLRLASLSPRPRPEGPRWPSRRFGTVPAALGPRRPHRNPHTPPHPRPRPARGEPAGRAALRPPGLAALLGSLPRLLGTHASPRGPKTGDPDGTLQKP